MLAVTLVLVLFALLEAWVILSAVTRPEVTVGLDLHMYLARTTDWLNGLGFYRARQLQGPYLIADGDALYPPTFLLLLVPFSVGLPVILWWLVPIVTIAFAVIQSRPAWWAWPILPAILVYPRTWEVLLYGNPSLWALAALAAGAVCAWPAALAILKPTLAPFALIGVRDRCWWLVLAVIVVASLPFAGLWPDYARALVDAQNPRSWEYTLGEWPIAMGMVLALRSRGIARWRADRQTVAVAVNSPRGDG